MKGKQRMQLNVAITLFERLPQPQSRKRFNPKTGMPVFDLVLESEEELHQMGINFKGFPAHKVGVRKAFQDLEKMVLSEMEKHGLLK